MGDPVAQLHLAVMMLQGVETSYAPGEALRLIQAASAQRNVDALMLQATLAVLGYARPQSVADALRFVEQAAAFGDVRAKGQLRALGGAANLDLGQWLEPVQMEKHHDAPRVFTIPNFLPAPVCAWLIKAASRRLEPTKIRDPSGGMIADPSRTNSAAAFATIEPDIVVQLVCLRIAAAIGVPVQHQEPTNVLHYARGQEYRLHFDFVAPQEAAQSFAAEFAALGQRIATVLVYLNDKYEGGETEFPRLGWRHKGKTGDAMVFWNVSESGERESQSLHAGLPVTRGEKWLLSTWVRERPLR